MNAPRIIDLLDAGPLTAHQIADRLSMNRRHMSARLLPKLADHGLLTYSGGRWGLVADLETALTDAAADLGLSGKVAEVAARHEAERAAYLDYRERRRPHRHRAACARRAAAVRAARGAGRRSTDRPLPLDLVTTSTPTTTPEGRKSPPSPLDPLAGLSLAGG